MYNILYYKLLVNIMTGKKGGIHKAVLGRAFSSQGSFLTNWSKGEGYIDKVLRDITEKSSCSFGVYSKDNVKEVCDLLEALESALTKYMKNDIQQKVFQTIDQSNPKIDQIKSLIDKLSQNAVREKDFFLRVKDVLESSENVAPNNYFAIEVLLKYIGGEHHEQIKREYVTFIAGYEIILARSQAITTLVTQYNDEQCESRSSLAFHRAQAEALKAYTSLVTPPSTP